MSQIDGVREEIDFSQHLVCTVWYEEVRVLCSNRVLEAVPRKVWAVAVWRMLLMVLLGGLGLCGTPEHAQPVWGATAAVPHSPAQAIAAGLQAFQRGEIEHAATTWREAVRLAESTRQSQTHSVALTYLARAYEALGHYDEATQSLHAALKLAQATADHIQSATILERLGETAMARGDLVAADQYVRDALALAHHLANAALAATILHTRGNLFMAQQQPHEALAAYQDSARQAQQAQRPGIAARALAHAAFAAVHTGQVQSATALLAQAETHLRQAEASHDTAYDWVLIGRVYHRLANTDPPLVRLAAAAFQEAAALAQHLKDPRAQSYAWGYLGRLYEEERRYPEALDLTRRAVLAAQRVYVPESLYLWHWQSGRLLWALGDLPAATAAYERAVALVQTIRPELLHGLGWPGMSFRTSLGPLYFELADLLLRHASALETQDQEAVRLQYERYLQQARVTIEQFKTAELREYFGDACVAAAQPSTTALEHVSPDVVVVYPILFPDRMDLLVSLPTGLKRVAVPVAGAHMEQQVQIFRNALDNRDPLRYLQHAQRLYNWLIRPLEADLAAQSIRTLVFVPDGRLRLLPLAALHDGQQFLIEKYAVAITPSLTLTEPRPLSRDTARVLLAGVAGAVEEFPPLPRVTEELDGIRRLYGGAVLRDQDFNPEQFEKIVRQGQFDIIHIATHGHFAADATQSFLLTTRGKLTIERLADIVGRLRFREQPLELLTLSACDTAHGDDRAALGLAGVAIQAGARSAVATLWLVADDAAAVLMQTFYQHLKTPGVSRAQALQRAQIALLQDPQYADPFFWAPFLLINNWL